MVLVIVLRLMVAVGLAFHHGWAASIDYSDDNVSADSAVKTQVVDIQNPDAMNSIFQQFNLSAEQLEQMRRHSNTKSWTAANFDNNNFTDAKALRVYSIRNQIRKVIESVGSAKDTTTYEMSAYPICTQINSTSWKDESNVTVRFAPSLFENEHPNMYLDTAVLRLHKISPIPEHRSESSAACNIEPFLSQIRVTISTMQQSKRFKHKKRRICNTLMLNTTTTGWVTIDVKKAIYIWERTEQQPFTGRGSSNASNRWTVLTGWLTIDVHDEDERQLNAGNYFAPPRCEEQRHGSSAENHLALKVIWKKCSDK
ncbi:unnamed protein product [Hermetia illucens]|uniref:Uncharacterized protein n=1 Tax=Hermetia illucens TaxID=343691 RepID=A0A7R8YLA8_HERIL|nr:protein anachronism isoform X2 [Hermetia illucens]CAD7077355.1 unnamed protein product [Hermetia illucens]